MTLYTIFMRNKRKNFIVFAVVIFAAVAVFSSACYHGNFDEGSLRVSLPDFTLYSDVSELAEPETLEGETIGGEDAEQRGESTESLPQSPDETQDIAPEPSYEDTSETPPEKTTITSFPFWMYIPALDVSALIQPTETDHKANSMAIVPDASIISWWLESSIPGNEGNAIFGGHNKWAGKTGHLLKLDTLEPDDLLIIIHEDETSGRYRLESVTVYALATAPAETIMDLTGESRVTIITCKDPFNPKTGTSDNRIVAVFVPEDY